MDNINVNQTGTTPIATEEIDGVHYQKVILVGQTGEGASEIELNWLSRALFKVFGRFSFDSTSQLRVAGNVGVSGSLNSITTVTTANMSIGDMGKASAAQLQSAQGFYGSVGANFIRS